MVWCHTRSVRIHMLIMPLREYTGQAPLATPSRSSLRRILATLVAARMEDDLGISGYSSRVMLLMSSPSGSSFRNCTRQGRIIMRGPIQHTSGPDYNNALRPPHVLYGTPHEKQIDETNLHTNLQQLHQLKQYIRSRPSFSTYTSRYLL